MNTLRVQHNLAQNGLELGDIATYEPIMKSVIEVRSRVVGADHPETVGSRAALAEAYVRAERLREAEPMLEQVIAIRTGIFGEQHVATQDAAHELARVYEGTGRPAEALALFESVQQFCDASPPQEHELCTSNRELLEALAAP